LAAESVSTAATGTRPATERRASFASKPGSLDHRVAYEDPRTWILTSPDNHGVDIAGLADLED